MKDFLGRVITQGRYIVYPGRRGSSLWVTLALILEVRRVGTCQTCQGSGARLAVHLMDGSSPCLTCMGNGKASIELLKVQPIDPKSRRKLGKPTTVRLIDKVTVVELPSQNI